MKQAIVTDRVFLIENLAKIGHSDRFTKAQFDDRSGVSAVTGLSSSGIIVLLSLFISLSLCSCGGGLGGDKEAYAKAFHPTPGLANLYLYRTGFAGSLGSVETSINGQVIGKLPSGQFQRLRLQPGKYNIKAKIGGFKVEEDGLVVALKEGTNTFLEGRAVPGLLIGKYRFREQTAAEARLKISGDNLMAHNENPLSQTLPAEPEPPQSAPVESAAPESSPAQDESSPRLAQTESARSSGGGPDSGQVIAGLAALGGAFAIANGGDTAGAGNFLGSTLGGIFGGRTPQASDFSSQQDSTTSAGASNSVSSAAVSANKPNLIDAKGLRNVGDHGTYYVQYADVLYKEYQKSGKEEAYALHRQTVESLESIIKE